MVQSTHLWWAHGECIARQMNCAPWEVFQGKRLLQEWKEVGHWGMLPANGTASARVLLPPHDTWPERLLALWKNFQVFSVIWALLAAYKRKDNIGLNVSHHQIYRFSMALAHLAFWVCYLDLAQSSRQIQRSGSVYSRLDRATECWKLIKSPRPIFR